MVLLTTTPVIVSRSGRCVRSDDVEFDLKTLQGVGVDDLRAFAASIGDSDSEGSSAGGYDSEEVELFATAPSAKKGGGPRPPG